MRKNILHSMHEDQRGHAEPWAGIIVGAVGLVALGIGAANDDMGWLAVLGGVIAAFGLILAFAINHATVEKGMYGRLDKLDGNK
jgi:hypothetical protein